MRARLLFPDCRMLRPLPNMRSSAPLFALACNCSPAPSAIRTGVCSTHLILQRRRREWPWQSSGTRKASALLVVKIHTATATTCTAAHPRAPLQPLQPPTHRRRSPPRGSEIRRSRQRHRFRRSCRFRRRRRFSRGRAVVPPLPSRLRCGHRPPAVGAAAAGQRASLRSRRSGQWDALYKCRCDVSIECESV